MSFIEVKGQESSEEAEEGVQAAGKLINQLRNDTVT